MPDKSMDYMYFRQYGTDTAEPHEYNSDPPPYQSQSVREATFLPEAPSPAPITGTGVMDPDVVMGDFLDDRIDERIDDLYTRIQKLENIVDKCCDDDEFEDVQEEEPIIQTQNGDYFTDEEFLRALGVFAKDKELGAKKIVAKMKETYPNYKGINAKRVRDALQLIRSGKTPEVTAKSAKKFDYKTSGFVTIKKADAFPGHNEGLQSNELSKLKEYAMEEYYPGIVWCPDNKWGCVRIQTYSYEALFRNIVVSKTGWICETIITPGCPLKLIKEKMNEGFTIEFEDENDKREVEAMQGGGYRRRNTRRKSRKRNTRRKSRKRNTHRKSRKRSSRRRSKKK